MNDIIVIKKGADTWQYDWSTIGTTKPDIIVG